MLKSRFKQRRGQNWDLVSKLPMLFCGMLVVVTVAGLVRLYAKGEEAFQSAVAKERWQLSQTVELEDPATKGKYKMNNRPYCTRITTRDGKLLWDSLEWKTHESDAWKNDVSAAWFGLLGGTSQAENTRKRRETEPQAIDRYFITNYYEQLNCDASYSPLTGMKVETDNYQLTIDSRVQEEMYRWMTEQGVQGSIFAYDVSTGDVICMASTPGHDPNAVGEEPEGAQLNKNLYNFEPGSTMKLVTLFLMKEQGIDLASLNFKCTGSYTLKADPNGEKIKCTGTHGDVDVVKGIGQSCNCFFAQCIELLDFNAAKQTLEQLGVVVKICESSDEDMNAGNEFLGQIPRKRSIVRFTPDMTATFNNVFQLIGQDKLKISPIDMATYTALCATNGVAAVPRLLENDPIQKSEVDEVHAAEFAEIYQYWKMAYDTYYRNNKGTWSELVTTAKTGTVNVGTGNKARKQRTLSLWSEPLNMTAFILVENYENTTLDAIANHLVEVVNAVENGERYEP